MPGGLGFKFANKAARGLTKKALKARRANAYAQFGRGSKYYKTKNPKDIAKTYDPDKLGVALKIRDLNKKSKYPRYSVAVGRSRWRNVCSG